MKILQIINSLEIGGAEKLVLESLIRYEGRGLDVDLLLLNGNESDFLKLLKTNFKGNIISLGNASVYNPLHIFKLKNYLKNYDLVHVHLFPAQYFVIFTSFFLKQRPKLVFTEHSTSNRRRDKKWLIGIERLIYKRYDAIICITNEVKNLLVNYTGLHKSKFAIIENGIPINEFEKAIPVNRKDIEKTLSNTDNLIIQVSSFRYPKDQKTGIKSLQYLPSDYKILLVGTGNTMISCKDLVKDLNLDNRVFFLGNRNDVSQLLKTADIIVLSSHYEGLSLSSIEGMASGKPFVASNVPGLQHVVEGAGILFPQGNHEALAKEIRTLIEDKNHYNSISARCVERARQYDISKMIDEHVNLYNLLLEK